MPLADHAERTPCRARRLIQDLRLHEEGRRGCGCLTLLNQLVLELQGNCPKVRMWRQSPVSADWYTGHLNRLVEALEFAAEGKVRASVQHRRLEQINEIFGELKSGRVRGRIVLDFV